MIARPHLLAAVFAIVLSAPLVSAQELSAYRDFHLGMGLAAVTTLTAATPSEARVIHERPALIQELAWSARPDRGASSPAADPVQGAVFSFYDAELFRIVVTYDPKSVEGLSDEDLIETMSATYGTPTTPAAPVTSAPLSQTYRAGVETIIARWEDEQSSVNLIHSPYGPTVSLVIFSKRLDALARSAITEAVRLDRHEAPARAAERQAQQDADDRVADEKARIKNRPAFRP